jgi:hypothetical protein
MRRLPSLVPTCFAALTLLASGSPDVSRAQPVQEAVERTVECRPGDTFEPVSLARIANAAGRPTVAGGATRILVGKVPFDLLAGDRDHLAVAPLGWKAASDESAEYPGYIANYDQNPPTDTAAEKFSMRSQPPDPTRAILQVPVDDYAAIWLLAATDDDPALDDTVTFRLGVIDGMARVVYHDFAATVPRAAEKKLRGNATAVVPAGEKSLFLVRVPIGRALAQDFKDRRVLDLDITKAVRLAVLQPDPARFQRRPLGLPSGVRILGLTLEKAPFRLEIRGTASAHAVHLPAAPEFDVTLVSTGSERTLGLTLEAEIVRDDGQTQTVPLVIYDNPATRTHTFPTDRRRVALPALEPGHYRLRFRLLRGKTPLLVRETACAVLQPNTRKHVAQSPFGTWDFAGTHYSPRDPALRLDLATKLGLRYVLDEPALGMRSFVVPKPNGREQFEKLAAKLRDDPALPRPDRLLVFHETAISGPHVTRTPEVFSGKPYTFSAEEQKRFDALWQEALDNYALAKEFFPEAKVMFGNGPPHLVEAFVKRGFPRELLRIAGNESGAFARPPEAQPPDFVAMNGGLYTFRRILDANGYGDVALEQCYEMCYPNSQPGNLSEATQARYLVRHLMHSLAWGIPRITPLCLADMGNSYYFSNWGATGLCRAMPDLAAKPAFVAYAVTTQLLDGKKWSRRVPTGTTGLYAAEFAGGGGFVTVLWTPRGEREVGLRFAHSAAPRATNLMGRPVPLVVDGGAATVAASEAPLWIESAEPLAEIVAGAPRHPPHDALDRPVVIDALDDPAAWTVVAEPSRELEVYNFLCPRQQGDLGVKPLLDANGVPDGLQLTPVFRPGHNPDLPMYARLRPAAPIAIPGEPTEIGVWVEGNAGWGRVIFELEDASGQRWISIGAEAAGEPNQWMADWLGPEEFAKLRAAGGKSGVCDWNSDDAWGRSAIDHEGWRFVRFPLPGQYPGEEYHWPGNSQWRADGGPEASRGNVAAPLRLTGLAITAPQQVLYLTEKLDAPRPSFSLKQLTVTHRPLEAIGVDDGYLPR